jgi:hypothetical protein
MRRESTPFVKINLTMGKVALISPEDADRVAGYSWSMRVSNGKLYAQAYVKGSSATGVRIILLHRLINQTPKGVETDHVNGNGLDNRRGNLRDATPSQNKANSRWRTGPSGFRGVQKRGKRWAAWCGLGNYVGTFDSAESAAIARDEVARQRYGHFARLNFPRDGERGL